MSVERPGENGAIYASQCCGLGWAAAWSRWSTRITGRKPSLAAVLQLQSCEATAQDGVKVCTADDTRDEPCRLVLTTLL